MGAETPLAPDYSPLSSEAEQPEFVPFGSEPTQRVPCCDGQFRGQMGVEPHLAPSQRDVYPEIRGLFLVELMGRYSNILKPLLPGQSTPSMNVTIQAKRVQSSLPRVHALDRRLTPEAVQQLLGDYQAGISANQLAVRYQLSRSSIRRLLRESDVPRRYQTMTELEADQAVELYQSGLTISQVAAKLNRPWSTVQTALSRRGVGMRSRHDHHK